MKIESLNPSLNNKVKSDHGALHLFAILGLLMIAVAGIMLLRSINQMYLLESEVHALAGKVSELDAKIQILASHQH